jgi:hypothetical protein
MHSPLAVPQDIGESHVGREPVPSARGGSFQSKKIVKRTQSKKNTHTLREQSNAVSVTTRGPKAGGEGRGGGRGLLGGDDEPAVARRCLEDRVADPHLAVANAPGAA